MSRFMNTPQFFTHFPTSEESFILTVGYDDFKHVKPLHTYRMQNFYTWHFVISGQGHLDIDGKPFEISGEEMFFIPPNVQMRYFPKEDAPWEYVWFSLNGNTAKEYGNLLGFSLSAPVRKCENFGKVRNALKGFMEIAAEEEVGYFKTMSVFYDILDICTTKSSTTGIHQIKKHIDESFALQDFNIETLCRNVGMSHAQILRKFKSEYGKTIVGYVLEKRIEYACSLLVKTDISVKSVAYSCGFTDEMHFMKTFKRRMGVSAGEYRARERKLP